VAEIPRAAKRRLEAWREAPLSWDPVTGGRRPLVCWEDDYTFDLGADTTGQRFHEISEKMLTGFYYPSEVIRCYGDWTVENRRIKPGERMVQKAVILPSWEGVGLWSMTQIFAAEQTEDTCTLGYVTTKRHFGRGKWQATLVRDDGTLKVHVRATAGPGSFWFWLGLPIARWLMVRARKRAVEEFRRGQ
jgi:hypothetical protein